LEFMRHVPDLDVLYVPIGLGSGICGALAARAALKRSVAIIGVVAAEAPSYALSYAAGRPVSTERADTFADGLAVRVPDADAFALIREGVADIVKVSEHAIREAMRIYFSCTHQVTEGAGAAALAALLQDHGATKGRKVGLILSGGNI